MGHSRKVLQSLAPGSTCHNQPFLCRQILRSRAAQLGDLTAAGGAPPLLLLPLHELSVQKAQA